jgi:hypothetical protein
MFRGYCEANCYGILNAEDAEGAEDCTPKGFFSKAFAVEVLRALRVLCVKKRRVTRMTTHVLQEVS